MIPLLLLLAQSVASIGQCSPTGLLYSNPDLSTNGFLGGPLGRLEPVSLPTGYTMNRVGGTCVIIPPVTPPSPQPHIYGGGMFIVMTKTADPHTWCVPTTPGTGNTAAADLLPSTVREARTLTISSGFPGAGGKFPAYMDGFVQPAATAAVFTPGVTTQTYPVWSKALGACSTGVGIVFAPTSLINDPTTGGVESRDAVEVYVVY